MKRSVFLISYIWILVALLFFGFRTYTHKKEFLAGDMFLLIFALLLFFMGVLVIKRNSWKLCNFIFPIIPISLITFFLQVFIFYNVYFVTAWDAGLVNDVARLIVAGIESGQDHYFSMYPNNQFILLILVFLYKINRAIGFVDTELGLMFVITIQCALSAIAGFFVHDIVKRLTKSEITAGFAYTLHFLLVSLSGWNMISYTDGMGIAFPIAIIWLYLRLEELKGAAYYVNICIMVAVSYFGYKLKPTVIIVLIAILIVSAMKRDFKHIKAVAAITLVSLLVYSAGFSAMVRSLPLDIDPEANMGITHMIKMGLNEKNTGTYSSDDVQFSDSIEKKANRDVANREEIKKRLLEFGPKGLLTHLQKKTLTVFNDGTFAWGGEGNFYYYMLPDKNSSVSPRLKQIWYEDGKYYIYFATFLHFLWVFVLFMVLFIARGWQSRLEEVLMLTLTGVFLFEMIFEARARQLYIFAPVFITAAVIGAYKLSGNRLKVGAHEIIGKIPEKILFVAPRFHPNLVPVCEGLMDEGCEVRYIVTNIGETEKHDGVKVDLVNENSFFRIKKLIREYNPDTVILRDRKKLSLLAYRACLLLGIPRERVLIYNQSPLYLTNKDISGYKYYLKVLWRLLFPKKRITTVRFEEYPDYLRNNYFEDENATFLNFVPRQIKHDILLPEKCEVIKILDSGKFRDYKNHMLLVEAAKILKDKGYDSFRITIQGQHSKDFEDAYYKKVESKIKELNLENVITLQGAITYDDMEGLFLSHDLYVLPSAKELANISILDAMAYGRPAICTSANGTADYILPNVTGQVFVTENAEDLASKIEVYLKDKSLISLHGKAAKTTMERDYGFHEYYGRLIGLL